MANLRANKITGTEVFETTGSVQFDGSGDVLTVPNTVDFRLGSGDFTLECFMYYVGPLSSNRTLFGLFENSSARRSYQLEVRSTGVLRFEWWADGSTTNAIDSPASTITSGQWSHIAVVRNGSVITVYLNGSSVATSVVGTSSFFDNTVDSFRIGALNAAVDQSFSGHISNVRVLKGTALYTKNFTPPTRELTVIPNTVLLCCQSTTRANEERTGKTITVNGNAVANELTPGLLTDRIRSGGSSAISGSVEFNGTGDYLQVSPGNDFTFGTNSFTIEMFVYKGSRTDTHVLYDHRNAGGVQGLHPTLYYSGNNLHYYVNGSNIITTSNYTKNTWQHYALVRSTSTNTIKLYINGIEVASASDTNDYVAPQSGAPYIGQNISGSFYFDGFISNLRVIKGTALYTQNFIPPTRELKNLPGTVLLCCQNSKSATQEATGKTITVNGNATARYFTPPVGFDGFVNFDGATKIKTPNYFYLPTGTTEDRGGARGVTAGGYVAPARVNTVDYITISTVGNAFDFGDLQTAVGDANSLSSSTRALILGGGNNPAGTRVNTIDFITISSTGNSQTFGSLLSASNAGGTCSSSTRGLYGGGYAPTVVNVVQYVTIASTGNAIDFGDLTASRGACPGISSPTRGIFFGGYNGATLFNVIDFVTISTTGNATDFGDSTLPGGGGGGCSNATRGIRGGGNAPGVLTNTIDYITMASLGNAVDFGDLTANRAEAHGGMSSSTRGVWSSGHSGGGTALNTIDYVTIMSTGNAVDFGDSTQARRSVTSCSNAHGGLG